MKTQKLQDRTILIVDDNFELLELMIVLFKADIGTVIPAMTLTESITECEKVYKTNKKINMALIDHNSLDGHGKKLMSYLKNRFPDIVILVMTNEGREATSNIDAAIIEKPFLPNDIFKYFKDELSYDWHTMRVHANELRQKEKFWKFNLSAPESLSTTPEMHYKVLIEDKIKKSKKDKQMADAYHKVIMSKSRRGRKIQWEALKHTAKRLGCEINIWDFKNSWKHAKKNGIIEWN